MNSPSRISGVLLPLFSLRSRSDFGVGDFGSFSGLFEWMEQAGQKLLMLLPLLPTAAGDSSPYSTRSAFGLNPLFLDTSRLCASWNVTLTTEQAHALADARASTTVRYELVFALKDALHLQAFQKFVATAPADARMKFAAFKKSEARWLDDQSLYAVLSEKNQRRPWWEWPAALANRESAALAEVRHRHSTDIEFWQWLQWQAAMQWADVRAAAKAKGVALCGDEPFIIGQDSADCWAFPKLLRRDARLGVPPDDFAADGQDWGLPWFDFDEMAKDDFAWLRYRAQKAAETYDVRRVDHAIGYFRQYIRDDRTPRGRFVPDQEPAQRARGERNFKLLSAGTRIVAEDLGVIPPFAREVLGALGLPGYKVMRWARTDGVYEPPQHYDANSLATTGTHDTDSLHEWWKAAQPWEREAMCRTFPELNRFSPPPADYPRELHEALLAAALNSGSSLCVLPWQDILGTTDRVNLPGTVGPHNWAWRMALETEALPRDGESQRVAAWLRGLTRAGRR